MRAYIAVYRTDAAGLERELEVEVEGTPRRRRQAMLDEPGAAACVEDLEVVGGTDLSGRIVPIELTDDERELAAQAILEASDEL